MSDQVKQVMDAMLAKLPPTPPETPTPRNCVSEQGRTGLLWTVFEGAPFSSRRIASFSMREDALEYMSLTAQLERIKLAVDEVGQHVSDDQGFILDGTIAVCVCCGKKAPDSSGIAHDIGCFTKAWQDLLAAMQPQQKEKM